jgi:predicted CXXCH cytochrome family protein
MRYGCRCCLILLIAVFIGSPWRSPAQVDVWSNGGVHPVTLKADADTATCTGCHSDIAKKKYVHTAIETGCKTCHQIQNEKGVTRVTLVAPVTQLCLTCHSLATNKVLHGPYKNGDCVVCHSPHSSDFRQHTWVAHQDICLGCHARARLKVNNKKKIVTTPWGVTLTFAQMTGWMFLNLDKTLTKNHPVEGHPISGPNTALGPKSPSITCMTCHNAHASNYTDMLIKTPPDPSQFLCMTCGLCLDCHSHLFP